ITFTVNDVLDDNSLLNRVFLFERLVDGNLSGRAIPMDVVVGTKTVYPEGCDGPTSERTAVSLVPLEPLLGNSVYTAVVTRGVRSAGNEEFGISSTWALTRQRPAPVVLSYDSAGNTVV